METIESRMRSLTVFFSHTAAFASIYAGAAGVEDGYRWLIIAYSFPFNGHSSIT